MASHDLQEPLRKIRLFSSKLFAKYNSLMDEGGKNDFDRIQKSAERMQSLIQDILTFSRISEDNSEFIPTELTTVINEIIVELDEDITGKKAQITVDLLPTIKVNPGLIRLLFHNLINNALKYCKKDVAPVIHITTDFYPENVNGSKKYQRILVRDNGLGFDQKYAEEVFGMFKRLHHEYKMEGTGIGLALCKKIAEHHQGFISALSKEAEGSTFILSLPIGAPEIRKTEPVSSVNSK
jgi:light-regulated signal transduction histidine kinase (bacteriophytochrome)